MADRRSSLEKIKTKKKLLPHTSMVFLLCKKGYVISESILPINKMDMELKLISSFAYCSLDFESHPLSVRIHIFFIFFTGSAHKFILIFMFEIILLPKIGELHL